MTLTIRNAEAERLVRQIADAYGITVTQVFVEALLEKLNKR